MCHVGVSNKGRSFSTTIGLYNGGKWVFNGVSPMPSCHGVVHFGLKMSCFSANFRTVVLKDQDEGHCVMYVSPMRAVLLPRPLGHPMIANGCPMRRLSHRGTVPLCFLR